MLKLVANNKKAFYEYFIIETYEAGISLYGTEVKSLRNKSCSIADSYINVKGNEMYILNMNIPEYSFGNLFNHEPTRTRKLLMHKKEIIKLAFKAKKDGMTIVPLKVYFNDDNRVKIEIALAKGKHVADKREAIKKKEQDRDIRKNY